MDNLLELWLSLTGSELEEVWNKGPYYGRDINIKKPEPILEAVEDDDWFAKAEAELLEEVTGVGRAVAIVSPDKFSGLAVPIVCTIKALGRRNSKPWQILGVGPQKDSVLNEAPVRLQPIVNELCDYSPLDPSNEMYVTWRLGLPDIQKGGCEYDLALLMALLFAHNAVFDTLYRDVLFAGGLNCDGELLPLAAPLAVGLAVPESKTLICAKESAPIVSLVHQKTCGWSSVFKKAGAESTKKPQAADVVPRVKLEDIINCEAQKEALVIALAGGHSILFLGPPGCGKSLLAEASQGILSPLSPQEMIEVSRIHQACGLIAPNELVTAAPFIVVSSAVNKAGLLGTGNREHGFSPGAVPRAHNGVLWFDELLEGGDSVIDALREPMERGEVVITRGHGSVTYPARFLLIATANACPCGNYGSNKPCSCTPAKLRNYAGKASGPVTERIQMMVWVPDHESPMSEATLGKSISTAEARAQVIAARNIQYERGQLNASLFGQLLQDFCLAKLTPEGLIAERKVFDNLKLSWREEANLLRIARTVADLQESDFITEEHISKASSFLRVKQLELAKLGVKL